VRRLVVDQLEPLDLAALGRSSNIVRIRRPEGVPLLRDRRIGQQRRSRCIFERLWWSGAAGEVHWCVRERKNASSGDVAVGGDGNLEKPGVKRNRKVFHNSLVLLWIAIVDDCR